MRISDGCDYALRAMTYLAAQPYGKTVTISEMAAAKNLSQNYLKNIFQILSKRGLVNSHRGVAGGISLGRPANKIPVKEIIETIDGPLDFCRCITDPNCCEFTDSCGVRRMWEEVRESHLRVLDKYNLRDLVDGEAEQVIE